MTSLPKFFTLNDGTKMPAIGFGTHGEGLGTTEPFVNAIMKAGYSHLDCAKIYGNEKIIG
jgi:alcohol dehydrogenase (NADP+)